MPQPDNRREQGAVTRGSQQQVAPRGKAPANISPMIGGAVSPGPQVQIGVQAQIQDSGTALYDAITGATRGIQQGIENYEKMYRLQSEKDYAEFETEYTQQLEKTKGDPKLMKLWLDNNTYKPNRVTARKYNELSARVSGQDYLAHQNDKWFEISNRLSSMAPVDALNWANTHLNEYDEASPVYSNLRGFITETQSTLSASARALATDQLAGEFRQDSLGFIERMHAAGFSDLTSPVARAIMQGRSLGFVQETTNPDGSVNLNYKGQSFDFTSIPEDLLPSLNSEIGFMFAADPDRVNAAQAGNQFNDTDLVTASQRAAALGADQKRMFATAIEGAARSRDSSKVLKGIIVGSVTPDSKDPISTIGSGINTASENIANNEELSLKERYAGLKNLEKFFDYEANRDFWTSYGINSQETLDSYYAKERDSLSTKVNDVALAHAKEGQERADLVMSQALTRSSALNLATMQFDSVILPVLAETSTDRESYIITSLVTNNLGLPSWESLTLEEYQTKRKAGLEVLPAAITQVDPTLSNKVGFAFNLFDPKGEQLPGEINGVFVGSSNRDTLAPPLLDRLVSVYTQVQDASFSERLLDGETFDIAEMQRGFERIARVDPFRAAIVSSGTAIDLFTPASAEIFLNEYARDPQAFLARDSNEKRIIGEAFHQSSVLRSSLSSYYGSGNEGKVALAEAVFNYGADLNNPTDANRLVQLVESGIPSAYKAASQDIISSSTETILSLLQLDPSEEVISETKDKQIQVLKGIQYNYSLWTEGKGNLIADLQSDDPRTSSLARSYVNAAAKAAGNTGALVRGGFFTPEQVQTYVTRGQYIIPSLSYFDANGLSSPEGRPLTAQTQAGLGLIRDLVEQTKDNPAEREGVLNLFRLTPDQLNRIINDDESLHAVVDLYRLHKDYFKDLILVLPMDVESGPRSIGPDDQTRRVVDYAVKLNQAELSSIRDKNPALADKLEAYFEGPSAVTLQRVIPEGENPVLTGNEIISKAKYDISKGRSAFSFFYHLPPDPDKIGEDPRGNIPLEIRAKKYYEGLMGQKAEFRERLEYHKQELLKYPGFEETVQIALRGVNKTLERLDTATEQMEKEFPFLKTPSISENGNLQLSTEEEKEFQTWWETNPEVQAWMDQFERIYGEAPNQNTSFYDYRKAWKAGDVPKPNPNDVQKGEALYHWSSVGKDETHPTFWKQKFVELTGADPDELGISEEDGKKFVELMTQGKEEEEDTTN